MTYLLFSNNAQTTLAAPLSAGATTATLATGSGARLPNPSAGQGFTLTLSDAATNLLKEIVLVTGRAGDVVTIVRAQEGTQNLNWSAGDNAGNFYTAGTAGGFLQMPGSPLLPIPVPTVANTSLHWTGSQFAWS